MAKPNLDHPTLPLLKERFPEVRFVASEFRGQTTVVVTVEHLLDVMRFLREDPGCAYNFLSDVVGVDYLKYPTASGRGNGSRPAGFDGRFAVLYLLVSHEHGRRLAVKVLLDPSINTEGIDDDPALHVPSVAGVWAGAEWPEREVFDMFGIRFDGHPDLRRILTWESFPAHPLRKDYPLHGRGERERYRVIDRDSA